MDAAQSNTLVHKVSLQQLALCALLASVLRLSMRRVPFAYISGRSKDSNSSNSPRRRRGSSGRCTGLWTGSARGAPTTALVPGGSRRSLLLLGCPAATVATGGFSFRAAHGTVLAEGALGSRDARAAGSASPRKKPLDRSSSRSLRLIYAPDTPPATRATRRVPLGTCAVRWRERSRRGALTERPPLVVTRPLGTVCET